MEISAGPVNLAEVSLVYSPPGVGKTELACYYPKPLVLMLGIELGLLTLIKHGRVPESTQRNKAPIDSWEKMQDALVTVEQNAASFGTLVLDTLNGAQYILRSWVIQNDFEGDADKFDSYGKGWARMFEPWKMFLTRLDWIRRRFGLRIVMLAHSSMSKIGNPDGDDYQSNTPELNEKWIWNQTNAWADNVLFANLEVVAIKIKGASKVKASKGDKRVLYVHSTASHFAKNRWGLKEPISMGSNGQEAYRNLLAAIEKTRGKQSTPQPDDAPQEKHEPAPEAPKPSGPKAPLTGVREGEAVPGFVSTFLKRIAACKKFGVICSLWPDIIAEYDKAAEQARIDHYPEIIKFWTSRAMELADGDAKYFESIIRRIEERSDLPTGKAKELLNLNEGQQ